MSPITFRTLFRILKELGVAAVETIERIDEEIELKGNKINVLAQQLKHLYHYDKQKINYLLDKIQWLEIIKKKELKDD